MSSKLKAPAMSPVLALTAAVAVALPAGMALAAKDDTNLTEQKAALAAQLQPNFPTTAATVGTLAAGQPAATPPAVQATQDSAIPMGAMTNAATPAPRHRAEPEGAIEGYALAKLYGGRALLAIDQADAAILAKDSAGAEKALRTAVAELDHARHLAFRDVIATRSGTVNDLWTPAGTARDGSADARMGLVAPSELSAVHYGTRSDEYAHFLRTDGDQVLIPVRDTLANLRTAQGYVRHGQWDKAQSAMGGIFDSSVMVSAGMPLHG